VRVRSVLVVGNLSATSTSRHESSFGAAGSPIACVEVLGKSVLERTILQLHDAGIRDITVVAGKSLGLRGSGASLDAKLRLTGERIDCAAREALRDCMRQDAGQVVLMEVGFYAEVDFLRLLDGHHVSGQTITHCRDARGALPLWVLDSGSAGEEALRRIDIRAEDDSCDEPCSVYEIRGYVKRLNGAHDLRQLAIDALLTRSAIRPGGREVRAGVWIDTGARVHRSARIVAPAYIGRYARVGQQSLITRCSTVEAHCSIGSGAAVEDASILADTLVGADLDLRHAVVDGNKITDLARDIAFSVDESDWIRSQRPMQPARDEGRSPSFAGELFPSRLGFDYSRYLARTAGLVSDVFKGFA